MGGLRHAVLPYDGVRQFLDGTLPYVREGLARGEHVLAVSGARNLAALREALGQDADLISYEDAAGWYTHPARTLAGCLQAADDLAGAGTRLRLLAEPVWAGRSELEIVEWQRLEAVVNMAFADTGASILCAYDLAELPPAILDGAWRNHPLTMCGVEGQSANSCYVDPWTYTADVDRSPLPPPPAEPVTWRIDAIDLYWLRALLRDYAREAGLGGWEQQCLLMSATEVATNALRYGDPPILMRVWSEHGELVCEVSDSGSWDRPPGHALVPPAADAESRFGLWAVRLLCSLVQVRTGPEGTVIRLHLTAPLDTRSGV